MHQDPLTNELSIELGGVEARENTLKIDHLPPEFRARDQALEASRLQVGTIQLPRSIRRVGQSE